MNITKLNLSALIRVALHDLMLCHNDSEYEVNMGDWHTPNLHTEGVCAVCLGGSVMAQSLGADPQTDMSPKFFGRILEDQLYALNKLRLGNVSGAFIYLGLGVGRGTPFNRTITNWEDDPCQFYFDMQSLANDLHAEGY